MDRRALADFLRSRRARLRPVDIGLPAGTRRRTPGLRREEVAQLAHISVDYYARLEQARGRLPSRRVLAAIDRALRLSDQERDHLFQLAGQSPEPPPGPPSQVRRSIRDLLDRMPDCAGLVLDAKCDVLAWNPLAAALLADYSALRPAERNVVRRHFLPTESHRCTFGVEDTEAFDHYAVAHLRAAAGRYPDDPGVHGLIADLLAGSPRFARLWATHEVYRGEHLSKTLYHPVVGRLVLHCDVLDVPGLDQRLILYTADPGSSSEQALRLLAVIGTQRMDVPG